jgi:hypothetical protein
MVEFSVRPSFSKGRIELGIADPGYDGNRWPTSDKYNFDLTLDEVHDLILKLKEAWLEAMI